MSDDRARRGLSDGYGVVAGTFVRFKPDPKTHFGRYHHGNLYIDAAGDEYHCAIDVDSNGQPQGHEWKIISINAHEFALIQHLDDGWHSLAASEDSGALDYIRSPILQDTSQWNSGDDTEAMAALKSFVADGRRYFVFGEPFTSGFGVHNVHQNQGSELGGGHDAENGIWQDGAIVIERHGGSLECFLNKFKGQAIATDDQGNPE